MRLLRPLIYGLSLWLCVSCSSTHSFAQLFDERFDDWPVDLKIAGTIIATDSLAGLPLIAELLANQSLDRRLSTNEPRDSEPRDSEHPPAIRLLNDRELPDALSDPWTEPFTARGLAVTREAATPGAAKPPQEDQVEEDQVEENRAKDTGMAPPSPPVLLWLDDRLPKEFSADERERLEHRFRQHLEGGGTLVVAGPHLELLSRWTLHTPPKIEQDSNDDASESASENTSENTDAPREGVWHSGLRLFPDCIVMLDSQSVSSVPADEEAESGAATHHVLLQGLAQYPRCVGLRVAANSVLVLRGRQLQVIAGTATIGLRQASDSESQVEQVIAPRRSARQRPAEWLVDLTQWRRRAIDSTLEPFPPAEIELPRVPAGALVIVGGGGLPAGLMERFVELAGGAEHAKLVYVPCEEADEVSERASMTRAWQQMGVKQVAMLHTKDRLRADRDEAFFAPLKEATGIWFGGGRQWNLADSYYGTTTHRLMKEVLQRGGVVGGSSAGASIQARYLARATPIENFDIMAPGYERGGLGFISGVAIDQHFSQRRRQADMTQLIARYPQLLGIGIDETTAIIVQQSTAQVVGEGQVYFYDASRPAVADQPDYEAVPAGKAYDLANRRKAP